jgi:hypothetical protein
MALTASTLSGAVTADQTTIKVASATGYAKGRLIRVDDEFMLQTAEADANATTVIPVRRGVNGTQPKAHAASAVVLVGNPAATSSDWTGNQVTTQVAYPLAGRQRRVSSYSASGAIALPSPGTDEVAVMNGTGTEAYSIAAPTKDMDGCMLFVLAGGAGAKVITVTGGISGAGSSYDIVTLNATAVAGFLLIACNGLWIAPFQPAMGGTVTNLIGSVA